MMPNSPLKKQPREALPPNMQAAFDAAYELHGDTTFVSVFGNAPMVYDWYIERFYKEMFYSGRIPREVVELVRLRLANIHGCAFCNRSMWMRSPIMRPGPSLARNAQRWRLPTRWR
jgi:alkylhydroperoxidase family enzyme